MSDPGVVLAPDYPFPKYVAFILGNEFCERYSYYGLRSILVIYLSYFIGFDDDTSTVLYHAFTVLAYLFPLVGAAIADGYWGKFNTILRISIVYSIGMVINSISAIPLGSYEDGDFRTPNAVLCAIGLLTIAFGTGGIKPCVSSFGGDQFEPDDEKNTATFFDLFYWSINAGSLLSTFLSPVLRQTTCGSLGTETSCYFLAFVVPAALMVVAILFFLFGNRYYKKMPPSGQNIFWEVCKAIFIGGWNKIFCKPIPEGAPEDHWLYGAYGKVDTWIIRDSKYVVRVLVMLLPIPVYRAAFDQQGSRWTLQAVRMNGYLGSVHIAPDQAQILNAFFILAFIPTFNLLYKLVDMITYKGFVTKLRKMSLGMVFAALAFGISAYVQSVIDVNLTISPAIDSEISLSILNLGEDQISGKINSFDPSGEYELPSDLQNADLVINQGEKSYTNSFKDEEELDPLATGEVLVKYNGEDENAIQYSFNDKNFEIDEGRVVWNMAVFNDGRTVSYPGWSKKDKDGYAEMVVISALNHPINITFTCDGEQDSSCKNEVVTKTVGVCFEDEPEIFDDEEDEDDEDEGLACIDGYVHDTKNAIILKKGFYTIEIMNLETTEIIYKNEFYEVGTGAAYTVAIYEKSSEIEISYIQDINTNDVSLALIIPQFFVITVAEVMINIAGLEFAYTQAPKTLKSVLTSFWLLTTSIGNIITIIVAEGRFLPKQTDEYLLFAGLILAADVVFILLAIFYYEYVKPDEFDDFEYPAEMTGILGLKKKEDTEGEAEAEQKSNKAFEEEHKE